MKTRSLVLMLVALALPLAGCSRQEAAWRSSHAADSAAAYQAYLQDYPQGAHAAEARDRLAELEEQQEWDQAMRMNTPEAFQRYLSGFPAGRHADAARQKLSAFLLAKETPAGPSPAEPAVVGATARPTAGSLVAAAGATGEYRVQLGAFGRGEAAARQAWRELSARHRAELGPLTPRVDVVARNGGKLWRLQAGPLGKDRAASVCAALKAHGTPCIVVHD